jgi:hypothetical protein
VEVKAEFAAIAAAAADLRARAEAAGKALPNELAATAISVAYHLCQAARIAAALAGPKHDLDQRV